MKLAGQTTEDINISIKHTGKPIKWRLGKLIVVKNLGVDILVGEPAKVDNEIVTIPHERLVEMNNIAGKRVKLPYSSRQASPQHYTFRCKTPVNETIYPKTKKKIKLPSRLRHAKVVAITPKHSKLHSWFSPQVLCIGEDGCVTITNETMMPVKLSRLEHFADIIECVDVSTDEITCGANVHKIYDLQRDDLSHLLPPKYEETNPKNHLKEVSVDPDNALSPEWKTKFKYICEEFSHIINPKPGRYNGFYGRVDNSINFSSTPPPSVRARLPKYSYEMRKILGDKMDKLEEWGVLVKPEDIGVFFQACSCPNLKTTNGDL